MVEQSVKDIQELNAYSGLDRIMRHVELHLTIVEQSKKYIIEHNAGSGLDRIMRHADLYSQDVIRRQQRIEHQQNIKISNALYGLDNLVKQIEKYQIGE